MIIENICKACNCSAAEAQEHLDAEIQNLQEFQKADDLRYSDFETACQGLGLDLDYVQYFISVLA